MACSGGADSVALAAATRFEAPRLGLGVAGVTVDHGLQGGSAARAEQVVKLLAGLGLDPVDVRRVHVTGPGGPESAARDARYTALRAARPTGGWVLLGHTLDDQAETVLLGLGRGSGPRSVAGMRPTDRPWGRPLLGVRRAVTEAACAALELPVWDDPHNADPRFTRVRVRREVLPLLEDVLSGGVVEALARTAEQVRDDLEALDLIAAALVGRLAPGGGVPAELDVADLAGQPTAIRRRVLRWWLAGSGAGALTAAHLRAVDALLTGWRGQGPVSLPRGLAVSRAHGRLTVEVPCGADRSAERAETDRPAASPRPIGST